MRIESIGVLGCISALREYIRVCRVATLIDIREDTKVLLIRTGFEHENELIVGDT